MHSQLLPAAASPNQCDLNLKCNVCRYCLIPAIKERKLMNLVVSCCGFWIVIRPNSLVSDSDSFRNWSGLVRCFPAIFLQFTWKAANGRRIVWDNESVKNMMDSAMNGPWGRALESAAARMIRIRS